MYALYIFNDSHHQIHFNMKKTLFWTLIACFAFVACQKDEKEHDTDNKAEKVIEEKSINTTTAIMEVLGTYTGMFGSNKITIDIQALEANGEVKGYSVVAGNKRPFTGKYSKNNDEYAFSVKEPGDNKYDGEFEFSVPMGFQKLVGKWTPFNKGQVAEKTYNLSKREFKYNTTDGKYAFASENILNIPEIENMTKTDLRMMRNEMYARHGYSFKMKDMRAYFENQDWYMPMNTDVRNMLTPIEKKNEELIKRYEKYAQEYYDEYGR